ncbi:MAG: hypothetical protein HOM11_01185 [Methylococcales bacterium]|nr:hypothetical protein [Methylococcales bacterium]MBT7444883.1 hypothetical protein [Methylococcales bacterium]
MLRWAFGVGILGLAFSSHAFGQIQSMTDPDAPIDRYGVDTESACLVLRGRYLMLCFSQGHRSCKEKAQHLFKPCYPKRDEHGLTLHGVQD